MITLVAGWVAGLIEIAAIARYVHAIFRGNARPNRATWWILTLVGFLVAGSYYATGARHTMWVPLAYAIGPLFVAILSLKYGEGGWTRFDRTCVVAAMLSTALWVISDSPTLALLLFLSIDLAGLLPTMRKSYFDPASEDAPAWWLSFIAGLFNLAAVERWEFGIAVYPLYIAAGNGVIACLLLPRIRPVTPSDGSRG